MHAYRRDRARQARYLRLAAHIFSCRHILLMPTAKSKRVVDLFSSYSPTNMIASLRLTMEASFTTGASMVTTNLFQDLSTTGNESSRYKMTFRLPTGAIVGELTLGFAGRGENLASGVSVGKTATSTFDPLATTTTVTLLPVPTAHYTRTWQQNALNAGTTLVKQVGYLDVRSVAGSGYIVTQTLTSAAAASLVLTYGWGTMTGALVSGTVRLDASATPAGIYTLGAATVIDG